MIDAHPQFAIPPETGFIPAVAALPDDDAARARLFDAVTGHKSWPDFGLDAEAFRAALAAIAPFRVADGIRAFYRTYAARHGKPRFGDKSPAYLKRLHTVAAVLPEARFIHVIRDGRDVALSHREVWFGRDQPIDAHISNWREAIGKARARSVRCRWYMEVRYEDLVREPERQLRRICGFIDADFEPRMLRYFEGARQRLDEVTTWQAADGSVRVSKADRLFQHRFTACPPLESRVFRYRTEMTDEQRRRCEAIAGELLVDLGYEVGR
jgi:hypothetical protein